MKTCESQQLFLLDRYSNFIKMMYVVESQKNVEAIAYGIIQQALTKIAMVLNNEARHV